MRAIVLGLLIVSNLAASAAASQSAAKPASGKPAIRACSLMTRDLVAKYDTLNPKVRDFMKPEEEAIGKHGSSCNDGGIFLQVDPFLSHGELRKKPPKDWQPVAGLGDAAFFRDNGGRWGELIVWTGPHHFTLQISVPTGGTAESVKPNATGLATALIAKLKN
jgi:hypothetical protein